jgi:hypothetical protein
MQPYKAPAIVMGCWFVVFATVWCVNWEEPLPQAPESIEEAIVRVTSANLFVSGMPGADFAGQRPVISFTVSKTPMTQGEANSLHLGRSKEDWKGKARVFRSSGDVIIAIDALNDNTVARWGDKLWVCGDPDVVREIVTCTSRLFDRI